MSLPTILTKDGLQPQSPASLLAQLIADVAAISPGYTANLPGSLISDISQTDVGAMVICDSARVELVNSLTPYGANEFILNQLGQIYGVRINELTNTSAYVVFSGPAGFIIDKGFTVSDGTHQYLVKDGGIIGAGGTTSPLFVSAKQAGSWAVPINTITQLVTSIPLPLVVTVTNPANGIPSTGIETPESYRSRVLQAGIAASMGMGSYLKTLLKNVTGVLPNLVSVVQQPGPAGGWEVIVGGGDPYEVAYAIYTGLFDISTLVGSQLAVSGITNANPGVVTTNLAHGLSSGNVIALTGIVGMTELNGVSLTITVLTPYTFSIGVNTSGYSIYISGGEITPNPRNVTVSIKDFPDTYSVTFVNPPQEVVTAVFDWSSTSPNYVDPVTVAALNASAQVAYIDALAVGQPMNTLQMKQVFLEVLPTSIPAYSISVLNVAVYINGVLTPPDAGTGIIQGDPEGYFYAVTSGITTNNI